jgi:hypothetical protein
MAKRTKAELIQIRETTYKPPETPELRCELRPDYINSLPQPLIGVFFGGDRWPIGDIDAQTGLLRIDVCGRLQVKHVGDVKCFVDASGVIHETDSFYADG